ncbi:MAG: MBG domain-containing protein [Clostridia bacterium]|nr:MBG domain-containing protein [Clostridia bacterium]
MKKARKSKVGLVVALVATLSCSSMVAVSQLCFNNGNEVITASAQTTSDVSTHSMTSAEIAEAWVSAVQESVTKSIQVTFTLEDNWTAGEDTEYTTSFGTDADDATVSAFSNGRIFVPANANIILDLHGFTIDRGLTGDDATAIADGSVFYVEGSLEITDSSVDDDDDGVINYGVITGGYTTGGGGGLVVEGGSLTLTEGILSGNKSANTSSVGGGAIYANAGTVNVNGGVITENETGFGGGAIYLKESILNLTNGSIVANKSLTSHSAGGIEIARSTVIMTGGEIINNTAHFGAGVYNSSGNFIMNGGEISGNKAVYNSDSYGGGVYVTGSAAVFTMNGGKISNNAANKNCGGVYLNSGTVEMNSGEISGNEAAYSGGVYISSGTFTMNGGKISDHTITSGDMSGGGVRVNGGTFIMNDGEINNNTSTTSGGGVYIGSGTFTLNGGKITGNTANSTGSGGGGVHANGGTCNINGGVISGNTATNKRGGGLYYQGGTCYLNGGTITGNTAQEWGGGVYVAAQNFNLTGGVVYGNNQGDDGSVNNVGFPDANYLIKIAGRLSSNTYIGVKNSATRPVTSGYTSSGNKIGKEGNYFINDTPGFEISNDGTEVTLVASTTTPVAKTDFDWSYKSFDANFENSTPVTVDAGALTATATYTGGAFVFNESNIAVIDDNGSRVNTIRDAGTYHLSVPNADKAKYNNPVFTFTITPADISGLDLTVKADSVVYTGSAVKTSVKVFNGNTLLEENKDYTLSFSNNINAGTGIVTVTAIGNYKGSYESTFTIEKAKLSLRWGMNEATYTGSPVDMEVYAEGLLGSDTVTLTRTYTLEDGTPAEPINKGKYIVTVTIDNNNYVFASSNNTQKRFEIKAKKVDVVWGETSFTYGDEVKVTAYYMDGDEQVELTVTYNYKNGDAITDNDGKPVNAGTYKAVASEPANANFVLTSGTKEIDLTIEKAEVTATWPSEMPSFKYDGNTKEVTGITVTGINNEVLTGLTYTYYDVAGKVLTENDGLPVDAGTYTVGISLTNANYVLTGTTEGTFTIAKQQLEISLDDNFNGEYDGNAKSPLSSVEVGGVKLENYTETYALIDDSGNVLENLGTDKPINAGKYRVTVTASEEDATNIENPTCTAEFEITKKEAQIEWVFGDLAETIDGVKTYLYDGTAHQPKAYLVDSNGDRIKANGEDIELTVTGTGKAVGKGYKAVATSSNSNYVLPDDNTTEVTFNVIKSKVKEVLWYEYGETSPLDAGVKPKYEYVFVYGQEEGAKLSAYGVLTAADYSITWASTKCQVKLNVTYDTYYEGYWAIGTYTATATLSSSDGLNDSCYMPLGINDKLEFEVTAITHGANQAVILWVIVNEDGSHTVIDANTKFIYNGELQAPKALLKLGTYDPADPKDGTYKFLTVVGEAKEAGTYYAYIVPDEALGNLEIKPEDSECKFVISPEEINIKWEGISDDGVIEVTYNGQKQAPKAYLVDEKGEAILDGDGKEQYLEVEGYTNAGTYQVTATTDDNHKIKNGDPVKFVIKQFEINTSDIVWAFADDDNGTAKGGEEGIEKYFEWQYDGKAHAPVASLKVTLVEGETPVEAVVKLSLTGSATTVGTHYTYATLDSADSVNANFKMEIAKLRLEIVQNAVTVIWDDADANGKIVYPYDGKPHTPVAHYINAEGNRVELTVIGAGTDAGTYVALITDDIGSNDVKKVFTIEAKQIKAKWDAKTLTYVYNGTLYTPSVSFVETELDEEGNEVPVTLVLDKDYTVSGFTNAGNYTSEITMLNGNYKVAIDATSSFVISKRAVTITWYGVGGYDEEAGEGDTKNFVWAFDGKEHAPTVKASVEGLDKHITVIGAESSVGNYTAIAILNSENYVISDSSSKDCKFSIVGSAIYIIWTDENGNELETFEWEYDGKNHAPKAYWATKDESGDLKFVLDEKDEKIELQVIGVGIYANKDGEHYTAKAILPDSNCDWADGISGKCEFTITKQIVSGIVWVGKEVDNGDGTYSYPFTWEYNGEYGAPKAYIADENGNKTDEELTVLGKQVNACVGEEVYTATAILADSENYAFADGVETTQEFTITAKKVSVIWEGEGSEKVDGVITWVYDGQIHCPTASFEDVNGKLVQIPVIGGSASGGQHVAKAMEVFENYQFSGAIEKTFAITQMSVNVEWSNEGAEIEYDVNDPTVITSITYTYGYDGKDKTPKATATHGDESVELSYLIKLEGKAVNAIIDAGTYEIIVSPADGNYKITAGLTKVIVTVKPVVVKVEWENVNEDGKVVLTHNGTAQAPEAYFEYKDGEETVRVTLTVTGAKTKVGEGYEAEAKLPSGNFELEDGTTNSITFDIVPSTAAEYEWDWENNGWKVVDNSTTEKPATPPEGSEDGDDGDDGEEIIDGSEEGDDEDEIVTTSVVGEVENETEGASLTEPETHSISEVNQGDEAIVPANSESGKSDTDGDDDGDDEE